MTRMRRRCLTGTLALFVLLGAACSDDSGGNAALPTTSDQTVPCPDSVVRRVDGGDPGADALPNVEEATTDRASAVAAFGHDRQALRDGYGATSVDLGDGFGRAWTGSTGQEGVDYHVVDVDDFGILVTLPTQNACPLGSALYVRSDAGLPLFFFAPTTSSASSSTTSNSVPGSTQPDDLDLQTAEPGRAITFDGAGDVRIGQVLDPSDVTQYETPGSCGYWGPNEPSHDGDEPLGGLVAAANTSAPTVRSIMVRNSRYRTASGVGTGTSLATLQRIYGTDLVLDRLEALHQPTDGLVASYNDVAAIRHGDRALTFVLQADRVIVVKVSAANFWGDDEGCA